jgi:ATP-dependent DNA ligase
VELQVDRCVVNSPFTLHGESLARGGAPHGLVGKKKDARKRVKNQKEEPVMAERGCAAAPVALAPGPWGQGLTAEKMEDCHWLMPALVGQFEFAEWTPDNHLRHSRFIALRDDKRPEDVGRE